MLKAFNDASILVPVTLNIASFLLNSRSQVLEDSVLTCLKSFNID